MAAESTPIDSRDSYPRPSEIKPGAIDVSQLDEPKYKKYQRLTSEFDKETRWNDSVHTKINKVDTLIQANVAPEHHHILQGKVTPYEKPVRLKQQFEPKGDTSRQSVQMHGEIWLEDQLAVSQLKNGLQRGQISTKRAKQ
ncbi:uncharacterized protein P174DRAFT_483692 [Aspergillus novofumigatus IBT 16806]|uniref:Uncharacterized protein n=1 Tax=Aspergillus novofumigatus (strain IBT 16806) TaxID=1392255 RepID=A0A2I1C7F8_ASPN1|nr:uncharacterized protein P174DRAFT_483692 [Aspergillus novofumigatus IBT 16806]PKX93525.1 hypothetical protein P174DRAFT_483692 [Aspergillus novofumigatus IBT 16806]